MNIERLYLIAKTISDSLQKANVQSYLEQIIQGINDSINSPSHENLNQISTALESLKAALEKASTFKVPNTWNSIVDELNAQDFIGLNLYYKVDNIIKESQPLLNVASKHITAIKDDLSKFLNGTAELRGVLKKFKIQLPEVHPGEAELSVLFPRQLFSSDFHHFIKEMKIIDQLVEVASEVETGTKENAKLKEISTCDPIIYLWANPLTIKLVLHCIHLLIDAYAKVQKIRILKVEAEKAELDLQLIQQIGRQATNALETAIAKIVSEVITTNKVPNEGRRNELINLLTMLLNKLSARLDRGMKIEGSISFIESPEDADAETVERNNIVNSRLQEISDLADKIQYFKTQDEPILNLPSPLDESEE